MSIMSQARLTLFFRNHLTNTARRHDLGLRDYCNIQQLTFRGPQPYATSGCLLLVGHELKQTAIENYNGICNRNIFEATQFYRRRKFVFIMRLVNKIASFVDNFNSPFHNIKQTPNLFRNFLTTSEIRWRKTLMSFNIKRYLSENIQIHNPASDRNSYSNKKSRAFFKISTKYDDDNYNRGKSREEFKSKSLVPTLSIVGFIRGLTSSDIEEEREKLTDEQKIKRMTPAELLVAKGVLAMCDQEYIKADELFHEALKLAQDENNDEQETLLLNLLASNSFESGDYESAEKLLIDLMKRMIADDIEPTDLAILELSLKLASIYSRNPKTHDKAMKGFKFVINTLLVNLEDLLNNDGELETDEVSEDRKDELALLGWSYDWFAKHLLAINDYENAIVLLKRALQISATVLGPVHGQTLILLNDIGTTMAMNDSPEEGRIFMKKAVEGALESKCKELASFYVNLGLVNLRLRLLDEARRYCEYSSELALKDREHHNSDDVIKLSKSCLNQIENLEKQ